MRSRYRRPKNKLVAEINVVPYIDVMLVLLIIFMVTAPLITQGVKVDLPQGSAEALDKDFQPPVVATVDADGFFYLDAEGSNKYEKVELNDLIYRVRALVKLDDKRSFVVRGASDVSYEQVVRLMIAMQGAGVPSVGLMTDPSKYDAE